MYRLEMQCQCFKKMNTHVFQFLLFLFLTKTYVEGLIISVSPMSFTINVVRKKYNFNLIHHENMPI